MKDWWEKVKKPIIILGIVGLVLALFLLPALARASYEASLGAMSEFGDGNTFDLFPKVMPHIFSNLKIAFTEKFDFYVTSLKLFLIVYGIFSLYCIYKLGDKKEYESIEHGSADWCKPSEAYKVLDPKQGVILANPTSPF